MDWRRHFFIDLRRFVDGSHITEAVRAIEEAIEFGARKFIVDLCSNGGGNSHAGVRLLSAMGISPPRQGIINRISPLLLENHQVFRPLSWFGIGYLHWVGGVDMVRNPNDVFVSVLTNGDTFSSATDMATWVQDGGFGNVVGSPSRNAPTSFGDILQFTLPYTGFVGHVSFAHFLRPDVNADQTTLWPDILTDPADALEAATRLLRNLTR